MRPLEVKLLKGCGCVALLVLAAYIVFWPVFTTGYPTPTGVTCLSNVKQSALALMMYASDSDDRFPARDYWIDSTLLYTKGETIWHCPSVPKGAYGYAFNGALSRAKEPKDSAETPMLYDSVNPIRNASDLCASLPLAGRHGGGNSVAYADGHARRVPARSAGVSPHSHPGL